MPFPCPFHEFLCIFREFSSHLPQFLHVPDTHSFFVSLPRLPYEHYPNSPKRSKNYDPHSLGDAYKARDMTAASSLPTVRTFSDGLILRRVDSPTVQFSDGLILRRLNSPMVKISADFFFFRCLLRLRRGVKYTSNKTSGSTSTTRGIRRKNKNKIARE
jgi:hypothetical protein